MRAIRRKTARRADECTYLIQLERERERERDAIAAVQPLRLAALPMTRGCSERYAPNVRG